MVWNDDVGFVGRANSVPAYAEINRVVCLPVFSLTAPYEETDMSLWWSCDRL